MTESTSPEPAAESTPPAKPKAKLGTGGLIFVGLIVLCCVGAIIKSQVGDKEPGDVDARVMCEQFVEDRLKSPKSADYSGESVFREGDVWVVTGKVDAQNSFGAMIRNSFKCRMTVSGDTWRLAEPVLMG